MTFDTTTIIWYGAICGGLAALAPALGNRNRRMIVGAIVGILAATILPFLRGLMGGY